MEKQKNLTPIELLCHSTIRIEIEVRNGGLSTGTGFFFKFKEKENGYYIPAIVTNKHVVKDAKIGRFLFTRKNPDGSPDVGNIARFRIIDFGQNWVMHPDPDVDLCILPFGSLLNEAAEQNDNIFIVPLDKSLLLAPEDLDDLIGLESIIVVGYPNGIWDVKNNFPVFRRGTLASNLNYDWNGKKEFIIDCATFPGSSGSPVLFLDLGGYMTKSGMKLGTSRIRLIGIVHSGFIHTAEGTVEIIDIPTRSVEIVSSQVPNNLGIVIKSQRLLDFDSLLSDI